MATQCGKFNSASPTVTSESIRSCTQSNAANSYYHMNSQIYAKRVECPTHLTQVTGCKLASQGLPAVNPAVTTPGKPPRIHPSSPATPPRPCRAAACRPAHGRTTRRGRTCRWLDCTIRSTPAIRTASRPPRARPPTLATSVALSRRVFGRPVTQRQPPRSPDTYYDSSTPASDTIVDTFIKCFDGSHEVLVCLIHGSLIPHPQHAVLRCPRTARIEIPRTMARA